MQMVYVQYAKEREAINKSRTNLMTGMRHRIEKEKEASVERKRLHQPIVLSPLVSGINCHPFILNCERLDTLPWGIS